MPTFEEMVTKGMGFKAPTQDPEPKPAEDPKAQQDPAPAADPKPVEDPKPAEDPKPNEDPKPDPKPSEDPSKGKNEPPAVDFGTLLHEKSNGKYKTYEEVEAAIKTIEENKVSFANEQIQKLNDYVGQGGDLKMFLETQLRDFSSMSDADVVVEHMMRENPALTKEDATFLYESKFNLNEEDYTENELRMSKINLKQEAKKARDYFEKFQKENALPEGAADIAKAKEEADKKRAEATATAKKQQEEWESTLDEQLSAIEKFEFDISKDDKFEFAVDNELKKQVKESIVNINNFWNRYINEDKSVDYARLLKDMARIHAGDKIDALIEARGASRGREEYAKELENPNYKPPSSAAPGEQKKSVQQQVWDQLNN